MTTFEPQLSTLKRPTNKIRHTSERQYILHTQTYRIDNINPFP